MRMRWVQTILGAALLLALPAVASAAEASHRCADGIEVYMSPPKAAQGKVVVVEVRAAAPLGQLRGQWNGRRLEFWGDTAGGQRALLGIDLNQKPGELLLPTAVDSRHCPVYYAYTRLGHLP